MYYSFFYRINGYGKPSYICPTTSRLYGGEYNLKVGLLSADEYSFAGGLLYKNNKSVYLNSVYLNIMADVWLSTPAYMRQPGNVGILSQNINGMLTNIHNNISIGNVIPVLNLKSNIPYVSGDGTKDNPYMVK